MFSRLLFVVLVFVFVFTTDIFLHRNTIRSIINVSLKRQVRLSSRSNSCLLRPYSAASSIAWVTWIPDVRKYRPFWSDRSIQIRVVCMQSDGGRGSTLPARGPKERPSTFDLRNLRKKRHRVLEEPVRYRGPELRSRLASALEGQILSRASPD